jgi:hypothetical protein
MAHRSPTVTAAWLRLLADLVEAGTVEVIRCDLHNGGGTMGVVRPDREPQDATPDWHLDPDEMKP